MGAGIGVLAVTAASIGFVHTLLGPDHYLPFIMMSRARRWSQKKTSAVTLACGIGHILSSVVLGALGVALGLAVANLELFEGVRGELASWSLMLFGYIYFCYGLYVGIRGPKYKHTHSHDHAHGNEHGGAGHSLGHEHGGGHSHGPVSSLLSKFGLGGHKHTHVHAPGDQHDHKHGVNAKKAVTPWALFVIFVLGPCEPLIPILMYPAAESSVLGVVLVTLVFAAATLTTMMVMVFAVSFGFSKLPLGRLERWTHAIAGGVILSCGIGMVFLGL